MLAVDEEKPVRFLVAVGPLDADDVLSRVDRLGAPELRRVPVERRVTVEDVVPVRVLRADDHGRDVRLQVAEPPRAPRAHDLGAGVARAGEELFARLEELVRLPERLPVHRCRDAGALSVVRAGVARSGGESEEGRAGEAEGERAGAQSEKTEESVAPSTFHKHWSLKTSRPTESSV